MDNLTKRDLFALLELARENGLIADFEMKGDEVRIEFEDERTEVMSRKQAWTYVEEWKAKRWGT